MSKAFAYIGSWKPKKEAKNSGIKHGIGVYEYDEATAGMKPIENVFDAISVGCVFIDKNRHVLYCVDETSDHPSLREGGGGQVYAFSINTQTGALTEINHTPSYGANPSFLVTDQDSKYLLLTNYGFRTTITKTVRDAFGKYHVVTDHDESNVVLFPLGDDGSIGDPVDIYPLSGEGPASFQLSPHAHSIQRSPSGKLYAVCDKGGDQVIMLKVDYEAKKLVVCEGSPLKSEPASAPRYSAFHPTLPYLIYNKENKPIITVLKYDENGKMEPVCTVDALPPEIPDPKHLSQSDIVIGKSGKYIYDLLRVSEVISVFELDAGTGRLTRIQTIPVTCEGPRGCAISADGRFLAVAALTANKVELYPIAEDGTLSTPATIDSITPGTVSFLKI